MASDQSDSTLAASEKRSSSIPNAEKPITETANHAPTVNEEKADIPIEGAAATPDLSPARSHPKRTTSGYRASIRRSRSYDEGYGFTSMGEDEEAPKREGEERAPEKEFEVQWDGDNDPMNPRCMSKARKWMIVVIVSAGSTCVTCTSSMYTLTYDQITVEWHISRVTATLGLSFFVMGLGIGPMVLGPLQTFMDDGRYTTSPSSSF